MQFFVTSCFTEWERPSGGPGWFWREQWSRILSQAWPPCRLCCGCEAMTQILDLVLVVRKPHKSLA